MAEELNEQTDALKEESVLLKEYQKLQENSVSKEKYEADLKAANDKANLYLKAITEGSEVDVPHEDSGSVIDTISELSKFKGTNLDYWKKMTKAIDQSIQALGEEELVKSFGADGVEKMINTNEGMKQMVKDSNDNPDYFRTLYKARVKDDAPRISAEIEKAGGLVNYFNNKK